MKKSLALVASLAFCAAPLCHAGVEMDMVTKNASGEETDRAKIFAQSGNLRMDDAHNKSSYSMIFLGAELLAVDHKDKSYVVMDEAMLNEVSSQISDAMKQMEAQLASLPPEQRAMAEQMMKGQMGAMMGQTAEEPPAPTVEFLGDGQWNTFECKKYAVFEGGVKTQEVCAAKLDDIDGSDEMMEAFQGMAAFLTKLTESLPMRSGNELNPGELMEQIGGFPVHTLDYENGQVVRESSLESVGEQDLDAAIFAAPEGYREQDPFSGR